jgi:pyridoxal phosphate enzyme (YggS family)
MTLSASIQHIKKLIQDTELSCNRAPDSVLLLAVSKQQSTTAIKEAAHLGLTDFGENYYQEALEKIMVLNDLNLNWHFIGPIQSNKTKGIAAHFSWVHSVNRLSIAERLNKDRPEDLPPLNICLQINIINETSKSGVSPIEAKELVRAISLLPRLRLRGLMTIPPPEPDPEIQYYTFMQLNQLMQALNKELGLDMDTLSMGMSDDLVPAIKAGATMVRIGQALFGKRNKE